jgi:hypothetical protein
MMSIVTGAVVLLAVSIVPSSLQELAGRALAAPPEVAADVLIRIAESDKSPDPAWNLEVLETAFQLAPAARYASKPLAAVAVADPEAVWSIFDRKLDTLSLQVRAVRAMFRQDAGRAAVMFDRIVLPRIPPLACSDTLGYSVHDYYALTAELFPQDSGRIIALARSLTSPWQIEPVARMLTRVSLEEDDFKLAVLAYAHALEQMSADDRSFAAVTPNARAPIDELGRRIRMRVVNDAFDVFVLRHRSVARCTDPAIVPALAAPVQHPVLTDADALLGPPRLR